jgi:hypothetical protein
MCQDRVMRRQLEQVIDAVQGLKCCLCFGISEPEPGVPGQGDAEVFRAVNKCCL